MADLAGVAAGGFAVSRLLLAPPDAGLLERLGDPSARASWPLRDPGSLAALRMLAAGVRVDATRAEWELLFGRGPGAIDLTESGRLGAPAPQLGEALAARYRERGLRGEQFHEAPPDHLGRELRYVAHLVAELARAGAAGEDLRDEIAAFRREHLDRFSDRVLAEVNERAVEPLWKALPGLVGGFLGHLDDAASP